MPTISTLTVDVQARTSKFSSGLKSAGVALGALAVGAGVAFNAFQDAQDVADQTGAVLKSTGNAANVTADEVANLASAISLKTGVDDEAIQSGENLLLTFTNIRNEVGKGNDIFNQTTQVVTDMSSALGQDFKSSAIQVGKAINDPIKGLTALQRVGVSFTAQQVKQITKMQESGDLLGAQKIILAELTKEFGGSAAAQADASDKAKVAFENLEESLGGVVSAGLTPLLNLLQPVLALLTKYPGVTAAIVVGLTAMFVATKLLTVTTEGQIAATEGLIIVQKLLLATSPWVLIAAAAVLAAVLIIKNWDKVKAFLLAAWRLIKVAAFAAWNAIKGIVLTVFRAIMIPVRLYIAFLRLEFNIAKAVVLTVFNAIKGIVIGVWDAITRAFDKVKTGITSGWKLIKSVAVAVWRSISGTVRSVLNGIIGIWNSTIGALAHGQTIGLGPAHVTLPDLTVPTLAQGGIVMRTGLALVHEGERFSGVGGGWGNVTVNVYGSVMTERDLADSIHKALLRTKRRSGDLGLA